MLFLVSCYSPLEMVSKTVKLCVTALLLWLSFPAVSSFGSVSQHALSSDLLPIFSDFDGDNKLDQAELFSNGAQKSIRVSLGKSAWKSLSFDSGVQDRGRLMSDDIDRDGDTDLVWVSQSYPRKFVTWLGDGQGNFAIATGHEHDRLEALVHQDEQARLADDPSDRDSTCVLQSIGAVALRPGGFYSHNIRSELCRVTVQQPVISALCFSVLRKRGPPSKFS